MCVLLVAINESEHCDGSNFKFKFKFSVQMVSFGIEMKTFCLNSSSTNVTICIEDNVQFVAASM